MTHKVTNIREARACLKAVAPTLSRTQVNLIREVAAGECYMPVYRLREALGSTIFDAIGLDASHNSLIAGYGMVPDHWRAIAQVVSTSDFKTMNASALSGLANLPTVLENAPYAEANQTDEKVSFPIVKRGTLLRISMEAQANDALGAFNAQAERLGASAKTTLNEFVLGTLFDDTPATDYDGVALFHATHANVYAVDGVNLDGVQQGVAKIMAQTGRGGEQIYLMPDTLIVRPTQMMDALALTQSTQLQPNTFPVGANSTTVLTGMKGGANNVLPQFIKNVIVTPHLNFSGKLYYYLVCGPANPMIQIAFLNGRTEPEILREPENTGMSFTHDAITWKVRHVYGGDCVDHRPGCRIGA